MVNLEPGEKIVSILHHHWIAFLGPFLIILFFVLIPLFLLPVAFSIPNASALAPLFLFLTSIWYLITLFVAFGFWMDYYLDALVITDKRILNVDQSGLFRHTVSEFRLDRVQDVTIEVPNFIATMLRYGNITIQTAGEVSFSISEVPTPHIARDLILKQVREPATL